MKTKRIAIFITLAFLISACTVLPSFRLTPATEEGMALNAPVLNAEAVSSTDAAYPLLKTTMGDFMIVSVRLVDEVRDTKAPPGDKFLLVELARPGMEKLVMGEFPLEDLRRF